MIFSFGIVAVSCLLDLGRAAPSGGGTTFGFEASGPQPFGLGALGSVEPLDSEFPWKAQWKSGGFGCCKEERQPTSKGPTMMVDEAT